MTTRDLSAVVEFFGDGRLTYPDIPSKKHMGGKTYHVPCPDGRTGVYLTTMADDAFSAFGGDERAAERVRLDDDDERDFYRLVLGCTADCEKLLPVPDDADEGAEPKRGPACGSTYHELLEDGVMWPMIQFIARDAFTFFAVNREFADANLAAAGKEAAQKNRAEKRAAARATKKTSSANKAGSSSSRASGARSTRTSPGTSRGRAAPAKKAPAKKTA